MKGLMTPTGKGLFLLFNQGGPKRGTPSFKA